jgi:peptidoglycan hydrolase-like protein with peptidoglycan-binding domain
VDGIFDELTQVVVEIFQYRVFLNADGIVETFTWKALYDGRRDNLPELYFDSYGNDVTKIQNVLKFTPIISKNLCSDGYYFGEIDGKFGSKTEAAVKAFQNDRKLFVDGVIATQTWNALMELAATVSQIGF